MNTREHDAHLLALAEAIINVVDHIDKSYLGTQANSRMSEADAAFAICDTPRQAELVTLLLDKAWDEAQDWASVVYTAEHGPGSAHPVTVVLTQSETRLIAAAPDMLVELRSVMCPGDVDKIVGQCVDTDTCGCTHGAAVAKAEGKP